MKKVFLFIPLIVLATSQIVAQDTTLKIERYSIDGQNIASEFNTAAIKWGHKRTLNEQSVYEDVYELEIKLQNANTKSAETIILTNGIYAGGYAIYFSNVFFPRTPEKKLRCEYYEGDDENPSVLYFYEPNSESNNPYAILELMT